MRNQSSNSASVFSTIFRQFLPTRLINRLFKMMGPLQRATPKISNQQLIMGLVFHVLQGVGTLAEHMKLLTGKSVSESALSQRRSQAPWQIFETILEHSLKLKAQPKIHPHAFYQGLRLCGSDGSLFPIANTPQVKKQMTKAVSRRSKAAFAKIGVVTLVELGLHNPIGAAIGIKGESEMVLARQLIEHLPPESLWICDRYYGVPCLIVELDQIHPQGDRHFLLRVRRNIKSKVLESYADGSALVEIVQGKTKRLVREVRGQVRRGRRQWTQVRLWTDLLDWKKHPAHELLALYAKRWEHEIFYKELKVNMRGTPLLNSHTPLTAGQEVAALILAYAILVDQRIIAGKIGQVDVLQISFLKTLELVRGLWQFLEVTEGILSADQVRKVIRRTMRLIAEMVLPKRRQRSCPRKVRQPVSSRPRLLKNTYKKGPAEYKIIAITA